MLLVSYALAEGAGLELEGQVELDKDMGAAEDGEVCSDMGSSTESLWTDTFSLTRGLALY